VRTFIIAEAGVNHNGDVELARQLVDRAAESGADAVKFQLFDTSRLVSRSASKAEYQIRETGSAGNQAEMLRALELSNEAHRELMVRAASRGIQYLSSPFDSGSLRVLVEELGITTVKVASGEITNAPFLFEVAKLAHHIILSTGMSTMDDVEHALGVLAFGIILPEERDPSEAAFAECFANPGCRARLEGRVTLLHCTSEYPALMADVNLRAMDALMQRFQLPVGYSDHTSGIHVAIAAAARGACVIEKHLTLDRSMPGPDHSSSLIPSEFSAMSACIRDIEAALGDGTKRPMEGELKTRELVRKSLMAAGSIRAGETFYPENIHCKRPGTGFSPFRYWEMLGRKARRDYKPDDFLAE